MRKLHTSDLGKVHLLTFVIVTFHGVPGETELRILLSLFKSFVSSSSHLAKFGINFFFSIALRRKWNRLQEKKEKKTKNDRNTEWRYRCELIWDIRELVRMKMNQQLLRDRRRGKKWGSDLVTRTKYMYTHIFMCITYVCIYILLDYCYMYVT